MGAINRRAWSLRKPTEERPGMSETVQLRRHIQGSLSWRAFVARVRVRASVHAAPSCALRVGAGRSRWLHATRCARSACTGAGARATDFIAVSIVAMLAQLRLRCAI
eukprot:1907094-Alexandrium_andersonii.AAC.1